MRNAIVLGGAGFIGSHLVERLLKEEYQVIVIDNLNTGKVSNLPEHPNLVFVEASILDEYVDKLFEDIDVVFHLAALTRPQYSIQNPIESNRTNVEGTLKILEYAKAQKVKRVVFTSSSSCYGVPEHFPTKETEEPKALSPYGIQKYMGELYAELYKRMYGLEVNCIRPFNVYGARQNPSGGYAPAVPNFIKNLSEGKESFITGDGEQVRDFTYVDDVVDMLMRAATSKVYGESFNAGAGRSISINYVYETIAALMGKEPNVKHVDALFEPRKTLADTTKAHELLGWSSQYKFEDGVKITIEETLK